MAEMSITEIQNLYDQIVNYKSAIDKAGQEKRNKLKSVNVNMVIGGLTLQGDPVVITPADWEGLPVEKKLEISQEMAQLYASLKSIAGENGPRDPKNLMFDAYAANWQIISMAVASLLLITLLLGGIICRWDAANGNDYSSKIKDASAMVAEMKKVSLTAQEQIARAVKDTASAAKVTTSVADSAKNAAVKPPAKPANAATGIPAKSAAGSTPAKPSGPPSGTLPTGTSKQDSDKKEIARLIANEQEATRNAEKASLAAVQAIQQGGATEQSVLIMVILLGALGGALHLLSSLVKFVGNREFKKSWILYYIAMPFTGAGLAPIIYMMLRVGIVSPSGINSTGSGVSNLNLMAIYAFAILSGLFSKTATDKMAEVFNTLFSTAGNKSKDSLGPDTKPAGK